MKIGYYFCVLTVGFAICGCGKSDNSDSDKSGEKKSSQAEDQLNVVTPQQMSGELSPANTSKVSKELTIDTPPDEICQRFLEAVRKKDAIGWERLLTRRARNLIRTAGVEMQYPGGEKGVCTVGSAQFNTSKQDIAMVQCYVQTLESGEKVTTDFSYLLRKQANGWKISGVWLEVAHGGARDLLSFENSDDVAQIKSAFSGESLTVAAQDTDTKIR